MSNQPMRNTMYIVSPLSRCVSPEKRDRFLRYISAIAPVTLKDEPDCVGYAWFRSAGETADQRSHWVRGIEVYNTPEASRVAHRASDEYKAFRGAVIPEALLERPSDLAFWKSTDIGFLAKEGQAVFSDLKNTQAHQYLVTDEMSVAAGRKDELFEQLRKIAQAASHESNVNTFWVLDGEQDGGSSECHEHNFYVISRFRGRGAYDVFRTETCRAPWEEISELVEARRETMWEECGIGFFGR